MTNFARELWRRLEAIHAVTYFAPEPIETAAAFGVRGFWRCYFGYRASPLGECTAGAVEASFFGFAPAMVQRAIPSVWELAPPSVWLDGRSTSAATALRRIAGPELDDALADGWLLATLDAAIAAALPGARPLFAANRACAVPADAPDAIAALWQSATSLREHRGDGHVIAWASRGHTPVEAAVLFVADGGTTRESLQPNRGWTDEEWAEAEQSLERRGALADGALTDLGREIRIEVERGTDALADQPFEAFGPSERRRLLDVLEQPARTIAASSTIPRTNPMGVRLLDDPATGATSGT